MMRAWWFVTGLAALAACIDGTDPAAPNGKQLSIVEAGSAGGLPSGLMVADTVRAGLVTIRFHSFGSSSCYRPDSEDVASDATSVTITAYDKYVPPNTVCTADFGSHPRDVMVSVPAGTVDIRVKGKGLGGMAATLKKTIVALP